MNKIKILCIVFVLCFVAACVPATTGVLKQLKVRVVDAETGAPVADATVDLHYFPSAPQAPAPDHPRATANAQGEITIQSKAESAIWQVRATGYIEQQLTGQNGDLPKAYAVHAADGYDGVIHLYQLPEPQLTVLVSDTYTGPLTIDLEPAPGFGFVPVDEMNVAFAAVDPQASYIQGAVGTRVFTVTASAEGVANLVVTPLLYAIETQQVQVRDSSGVLPHRDIANPQDIERGVWGTVNEDDKQLHHQIRLFVGTLEAYQKFAGSAQ
jgi:hypothetical protein